MSVSHLICFVIIFRSVFFSVYAFSQFLSTTKNEQIFFLEVSHFLVGFWKMSQAIFFCYPSKISAVQINFWPCCICLHTFTIAYIGIGKYQYYNCDNFNHVTPPYTLCFMIIGSLKIGDIFLTKKCRDLHATKLSSAQTDRCLCLFICRFRGGMWKDHSAIPQEGLGGNRLSSGGGDGEWKQPPINSK